jgi:hypothetical protein
MMKKEEVCEKLEHKVVSLRKSLRNSQVPKELKKLLRNASVATHNTECYKFHNYGHITHDCRSIIDTYMIEKTDIKYKRVWKRKTNRCIKRR